MSEFDNDYFEGCDENYPQECPDCGQKLELDTDYEGKYIVSKLYCANDKCNCEETYEFGRVHEDDVEID